MTTSGQSSEPWGFLLRYSVYVRGPIPDSDEIEHAALELESVLEAGANDVHRIGVYIEDVPDEPKEQVGT